MEDDLIKDYKEGLDIYSICAKYHIGKLKVKKILTDNNIELRKRGGQPKNKVYVISDWKIEKYPEEEGFVYAAIDKNNGVKFYDHKNQGGFLTSHIKNTYGVEIPTLYDRREYYKETGNYWWEQWFDIVKEEKKPTKKCPYCDWETTDVENKSGAFEVHLKEAHNMSIETYLTVHKEDESYFKTYKKQIEREELFKEDKYYVICPICGEKMKKITLWHVQNKHNMTLSDFRKKYEGYPISSDFTSKQDKEHFKLANLTVSKKRFVSKYEKEIQEFLSSKNVEFAPNRQILIGKEIDLMIENSHIGIEFDGLKFHTEWFGKKDRKYHVSKTIQCNEQGYGLIHIFEDEYVQHKDIVLSKVSHILGLNKNLPKISGRKIQVSEIHMHESSEFLNKYHIQGFASSTVYLGGFYEGKLVAVMSFKHGNVKNPNWELTRFATDYNYTFQGVGSKMFAYFLKHYEPNIIVSFADRRWTVNKEYNLYTILGFTLESVNAPDYRYYNEKIDKFKRVHKMTMSKQLLHKKYGFPLTMTETEMAKELGYDRIWDCGLFKYVWKKEEC